MVTHSQLILLMHCIRLFVTRTEYSKDPNKNRQTGRQTDRQTDKHYKHYSHLL